MIILHDWSFSSIYIFYLRVRLSLTLSVFHLTVFSFAIDSPFLLPYCRPYLSLLPRPAGHSHLSKQLFQLRESWAMSQGAVPEIGQIPVAAIPLPTTTNREFPTTGLFDPNLLMVLPASSILNLKTVSWRKLGVI